MGKTTASSVRLIAIQGDGVEIASTFPNREQYITFDKVRKGIPSQID
jgi:hypothetical protein